MRLPSKWTTALVVSTGLVFTGRAEAHFLQTDPVGYKDDIDLYTYVGDDPVNRADPTGMTCTGTGQQTVCQVDKVEDKDGNLRNATAADHKQYSRFEASYTSAVRGLYATGRTTTVSFKDASGKVSFKITAASLARGLSSRTVAADPTNASQARGATGQVTSSAVTPEWGAHTTTFVGSYALGSNTASQRETIAHEGLHGSPEEKAATSPYSGPNDGNGEAQQIPYNDAGEYLQGMRNSP